MRKEKNDFRVYSSFAIVFCCMLGFLFSNSSAAQAVFDPKVNCINGCTAKDIKKITAALVYPNAPYEQLPSNFNCTSGQQVTVKLAIFLTTSTQKAGLYAYAK